VKCSGAANEACGATSLRADYALLAQSPQDISAGLKFATKHKLRVTVRNTGHDFLARLVACLRLRIEWSILIASRHSGLGGLTISTHNLKGVTWTESWRPTAGTAAFVKRQAVAQQPAAVIMAGNTWGQVISALRSKRQAVVHGAQSVSRTGIRHK
jgi:hypothetical protein